MKRIDPRVVGDRIYRLRTRAGLAQWKLARLVGVTDKAVSKWETGRALPSASRLAALTNLFGVPLDELIGMKGEQVMTIRKIVVTGGPCAGKTTAMSRVRSYFTKKGWTVLCVPETATELITAGAPPWDFTKNVEYQKCQMALQQQKENVYEQAARGLDADKVLIVCDRGMLDNKAYMDDAEFSAVLRYMDASETELRDGYDAVFDLTTAAVGAEEYYTLDNNQARTEGLEAARRLDAAVVAAWSGHPHLRIIGNDADFENKIRRLLKEISSFLGEPDPLEIERKFLIVMPDLKALAAEPNCTPVDIVQTYLMPDANGDELRIRQRGADGDYLYYMTRKHRIDGRTSIETERRLSQTDYLTHLTMADPSRRPIRKTRYCLPENGRYYEIDVFPEWPDKAVLEIELSSRDESVEIPARFDVIREVTDDPAYKMSNMALIRH